MAGSLSNLVNIFLKEFIKLNVNLDTMINDCFLEYTNFKHDLTEYKYLRCNKKLSAKP